MTRKDYVAIADALHTVKESTVEILGAYSTVKLCAIKIADKLQDDNERFDRGRFMRACGFSESA